MSLWDSTRIGTQSYSHPWLAEILFALDSKLLRSPSVLEYTADPSCVFRLEIAPARQQIMLRDGTQVRRGQRIAKLHFWNEHIPPVPECGATIRWARQMQKSIQTSLLGLKCFLDSRSDLADIAVVCADVPSGTAAEREKVARIMGYYGFEAIAEEESLPLAGRLHRFGENILISMRVFAQNKAALRLDTLARVRVPICLSRAVLQEKFGSRETAFRSVEA